MTLTRTCHWCFKIGNRKKSIYFYRDVMKMTVLRHEEFERGCEATCNGPYDNMWSKTMIGYGPEDGINHFVLELTYNYPIRSYTLGNDFRYLEVQSKKAIDGVKTVKWPYTENGEYIELKDADGYPIKIKPGDDKITKCSLNVSNLNNTIKYWCDMLDAKLYEKRNKTALIGFGDTHCKLEFTEIGEPIDRKTAWGRVAFSRSLEEVRKVSEKINQNNFKILHSLRALGTPGKATCTVVILQDPDDLEICFVEEENYCQLRQNDPDAEKKLNEAIEADQSDEWFNSEM
ncbi:glyoxalase domain-containing protein 4-like protein [Dinothrombium tinctorium]|uniref:Glyoxalase domain-containing protein 4-like protein n=1 Tax=Dinothrombium tinctorium TaxID=1965070 RepID=A0A3S3PBZ4_9ACAR|nr:glyoxalase domain-containing protein 4-like protein [Dinothrombium tinctorium]